MKFFGKLVGKKRWNKKEKQLISKSSSNKMYVHKENWRIKV